MAEFYEDGYQSALLGDKRRSGRSGLNDHAHMYAKGGIAARVIDIPADVSMSRGVEIDGDAEALIDAELKRLDLVGNMSDALRWSRLDGGAALLLMTEDGQLFEPLPDVINRITEIRVIEMNQITVAPGGYYNDPLQDNYGEPEIYQITPTNYAGGTRYSFNVHESRLFPVYGDPLPQRIRTTMSVPWAGRSAAIKPFESIGRYERSLHLALEIMRRKQQAVHKMKGLMQMLQTPDGERQVRKRVDLVDETRSVLNGVAVDSEDDYAVYDQNVSGIKDLISEFQIAVSSDSGIPVTTLFGRSAAGLNSTGQHDLENLYDLCEGLQRTSAQPAIERLVKAICRQRGTTWPNEWSIRWPSLWTPTDAEQADTRLKNAQADKAEADAATAYKDSGALDERNIRDHLEREGRYGLEVSDG